MLVIAIISRGAIIPFSIFLYIVYLLSRTDGTDHLLIPQANEDGKDPTSYTRCLYIFVYCEHCTLNTCRETINRINWKNVQVLWNFDKCVQCGHKSTSISYMFSSFQFTLSFSYVRLVRYIKELFSFLRF